MSVERDTADLLERLWVTSPQQRVLRLSVVVATLVLLAAIPAAGGVFHAVFSVLAVVLALVVAVLPESHAGVALLLGLGVLWAISVPERLDGWLLLAAVTLMVVHLACTLAAYGPAGHHLDGDLLLVWARRGGLCVVVTLAVWLLARAISFLDLPGSGLLLGAALVVVLAWVTFLTLRLADPDRR